MTDRDRDFRERWQDGSTGPAPTTESIGDPEAEDEGSAAEEGAAAGSLVGAAVAGPFGLAAGAAVGAAVGGAGEAADANADAGYERRTEGTGPIDPIHAADGGPLTAEDADAVAGDRPGHATRDATTGDAP